MIPFEKSRLIYAVIEIWAKLVTISESSLFGEKTAVQYFVNYDS
jgi:hypothetical protein